MTTIDQRVTLERDINLDVLAALSKLTDRQREIYVDYVVLEQSRTQISERMGITIGAVNSTILFAQKKMRREMHES